MSSEVLEMYEVLGVAQKRHVDEIIHSLYMAAGRNNMHNSKTFEEVQIATEAFEDLCSMTRHIEKAVSLNGTMELAEH